MKTNTELLIDVIHRKKRNLEMFIKELNDSLDLMDEAKIYFYEYELCDGKEKIAFLDELLEHIDNSSNFGMEYLKKYCRENCKYKDEFISIKVSKAKIVKELIKEYKVEYLKNYCNNKYLGLNGIFDNKLFCSIIERRINKYVNCNNITKNKYKHLVAFLNEFLHDMENSNDPLKTLKHKIKLYKKYRKKEYIEIRSKKNSKMDIIKDILEEYKREKAKMRCK
jgi:hypothetical protein